MILVGWLLSEGEKDGDEEPEKPGRKDAAEDGEDLTDGVLAHVASWLVDCLKAPCLSTSATVAASTLSHKPQFIQPGIQ